MQSYAFDTIFVYDNVLTNAECNEIITNINNLPLKKMEYNNGNNVLCSEIFVNEIKNDQKRREIDDKIYKCIGKIIQNIKNDKNVVCRGDTGYELRKITGATRGHVDGTISHFENYIKENKEIPNNQVRNMSVIIALNSDYEGGEFCFPTYDVKIKLNKGQAIAFPPYWTHPHYTNDLKNDTYRYTITTWLTE